MLLYFRGSPVQRLSKFETRKMTPIAHAIAKQATLPPNKRKPIWLVDKKEFADPAMFVSDIHCFECTEVADIACDLADSGQLKKVGDDTAFLPAPRTWIEHRGTEGRSAWLLTENPFSFTVVLERDGEFAVRRYDLFQKDTEHHLLAGFVLAMLAVINAPHIVNRNELPPHRGLERLWAKRYSKFPLHAWHELKLNISKPMEIDDGEPHSDSIGGRRALHFCRAHLRIRLGHLEYVTSHWRGDAALGTKLTRYRMVS